MTILMIGGAGFIGSVTTEYFINKKHKVIVLDDLSTGFKKLVHPKAKFYKGSMLDERLLERIFTRNKIDVVALYAAKIVVPESVLKPAEYYQTNVGGTATVLKIMNKFNVKNIIFTSSAAVYGNLKDKASEKALTTPINPYGETKLVCEQLIKDAQKANNINYAIFRFFNVAGASDSNKYGMAKKNPTLLIPSINDSLLFNRQIKICGKNYKTKDGTCIRDYVDVRDLANAAYLSLSFLKKGKSGIFNLGSNYGYSVLEVVSKAIALLKPDAKYIFVSRRNGDPDFLITDNSYAKKVLDWKPKRKLEEMIISDYKFRKIL